MTEALVPALLAFTVVTVIFLSLLCQRILKMSQSTDALTAAVAALVQASHGAEKHIADLKALAASIVPADPAADAAVQAATAAVVQATAGLVAATA